MKTVNYLNDSKFIEFEEMNDDFKNIISDRFFYKSCFDLTFFKKMTISKEFIIINEYWYDHSMPESCEIIAEFNLNKVMINDIDITKTNIYEKINNELISYCLLEYQSDMNFYYIIIEII